MSLETLVLNFRLRVRHFRIALRRMRYRLLMLPIVFFSLLLARLFFRLGAKPDKQLILIIRSDGIGDFVLTTPFLRELRRRRPEYRIILCVRTIVYDLAIRCPYVDHVITLPSEVTTRKKGLRKYFALLRFARNELQPLKAAISINPRFDFDNDWIPLLQLFSGAPMRVGYTRKTSRPKAAFDFCCDSLLSHVIPANPPVAHESIRGLNILRALDIFPLGTHPELWVNKDDECAIKDLMSTKRLVSREIFAVGVSALGGRKMWPIERHQRIIRELAKKGLTCLLLGSSGDGAALQRIAEDPNCRALNLAGKLLLPEIHVLLKHCLFFLGGDSGLAHIAATVCPTIVVSPHPYGGDSSSAYAPERFRPLGNQVYFIQPHKAVPPCRDKCVFNMAHCIRGVTEEQVMEAVNQIV